MSNLIEHARYEMTRAGLFDEDADYGGAHAKAVMALIEMFDAQGHSGASAAVTLAVFSKLAQFQPLGGLTNDPSEWGEVAKGVWQNRQCGSAFSRDGGQTWYDIDDPTRNNGDVWQRLEGWADGKADDSNAST